MLPPSPWAALGFVISLLTLACGGAGTEVADGSSPAPDGATDSADADGSTAGGADGSTAGDAAAADSGPAADDGGLPDGAGPDTGAPQHDGGRVECVEGATEFRTRYAEMAPAHRVGCMEEVQARSCVDGAWEAWSGSFEAANCSPLPPEACGDTPSGGVEMRMRFEQEVVPFGASCEVQTQSRTCVDGEWGSWDGSFAFEQCEVTAPAPCDGQAHGAKRTRSRYAVAEVFNADCVPEVQESVCYDGAWGVWSGTASLLSCTRCNDADGDQRGQGCSLGPDCNDAVSATSFQRHWPAQVPS